MIRVLIVEDDFRVAQVHVAFARRVAGFRVVGTARTGREARDLVEQARPDLLLLDTYLPDESGRIMCSSGTESARISDGTGCAIPAESVTQHFRRTE